MGKSLGEFDEKRRHLVRDKDFSLEKTPVCQLDSKLMWFQSNLKTDNRRTFRDNCRGCSSISVAKASTRSQNGTKVDFKDNRVKQTLLTEQRTSLGALE